MQLNLTRYNLTDKSSIGRIVIDGVDLFTSLEPVMREVPGKPVAEWKVMKTTAIPVGTYEVKMQYSERWKKKVPTLQNVEDFEGVEMHVGNWPQNTEGCILVGLMSGNDYIGRSVEACKKLYDMFDAAEIRGERSFITIANATPASY